MRTTAPDARRRAGAAARGDNTASCGSRVARSWDTALRRRLGLLACFIGWLPLSAVAGEDFFNTFALAAPPDGRIVGRVRKATIPAFEGWYFRPAAGSRLIECDLGRIGVGICHDCATGAFFNEMAAGRPDLILMPYSAPEIGGLPFAGTIAALTREQVAGMGAFYARSLGVATLLVNTAAAAEPERSPIPLLPGLRVEFAFNGGSSVCAAGGEVLQRLGGGPGLMLAQIELEPAREQARARIEGYWALPPGRLARASSVAWRALDALGRWTYCHSRKRRRAALAAGARHPQ